FYIMIVISHVWLRHAVLLQYVCSLFYNSASAHRNLPSFPTRRSSDLGRFAQFQMAKNVFENDDGVVDQPGEGQRESAEHHGVDRSEEHTSELQSLAYLVCRLLLEKKKRKIKPKY